MNKTAVRLLIAVVLLLVIHAGLRLAKSVGGWTKDISPPQISITKLPTALPENNSLWTSEQVELDPRVFRAIGASEAVSRIYKNRAGREITLHGAVFGEYYRTAPHGPTICYSASGWTVVGPQDVELDVPGGDPVTVRLTTFDMEGRRIQVMYWYQMGDQIFVDSVGLDEARLALRDGETWPSIVKILLQTSASNPVQAQDRLQEMASFVYAWTKNMQ